MSQAAEEKGRKKKKLSVASKYENVWSTNHQ